MREQLGDDNNVYDSVDAFEKKYFPHSRLQRNVDYMSLNSEKCAEKLAKALFDSLEL
ncbi:hypothetical protein [Methanofollis formosanus]|uniref:hypothetical protein n=1 Tax=Methanofollis formosanus TaxID=299308 RepID=UPI001C7D0FAA|nr:hypothetical protein [Methanofollis formosanus]